MSVVEVHPRKERMGAAIQELESNVSGYIPQHGVVAHPEAIFGVVAVGIPGIDSGHGAGVGRDQSGKRKGAAAGGEIAMGPMTYEVNGKQYVAFAAGSSLFTFALK